MKYLLFIAFILLSAATCYGNAYEDSVVASVIIREAGGEGEAGMRAVKSVIHNRSVQRHCSEYSVVIAAHQFSSLHEAIDLHTRTLDDVIVHARTHSRWGYAVWLAAHDVPDCTNGSTYFDRYDSQAYWIKKVDFQVAIGNHRFYKDFKRNY